MHESPRRACPIQLEMEEEYDDGHDQWITSEVMWTDETLDDWADRAGDSCPPGITVEVIYEDDQHLYPDKIVAIGNHQPSDGSAEKPDVWAEWDLDGGEGRNPLPSPDDFVEASARQRQAEREAKQARLAYEASGDMDALEAYAAGDDSHEIYWDDIAWTGSYVPDENWTSFLHIAGSDHNIGDAVTVESWVVPDNATWIAGPQVTLTWNERLAALAAH